jgi:hypothetical protein
MNEFIKLTVQNWQNAWYNKAFRNILILEVILLITLLVSTSFFFSYIQDLKEGIELNDWVLKVIPARDVSVPIVILMSSVVILYIIRCATNPNLVILFVLGAIFQLIFRIITINTTRFLAPPELIVLQDPMANVLYQSRFITKDLFYSGHTAAMFLFFLCANKKQDKYYILFSTIMVGSLLLVQHVHYTVDVAFAPLFAFLAYWLAKRILLVRNISVVGS